jgi:6-phosphofructokinase
LSPENHDAAKEFVARLQRLKINGLICVGGDGTLNGTEVMGRPSGHIAPGAAYGRPDILLVPE